MTKYKISARVVPEGFWWPYVFAINDMGQVCGYAHYPDDPAQGTPRPMVWLGSGAGQAIAVPGDEGIALDINEAGDVVGAAGPYVGPIWPASAFLHRNGATTLLSGLPGPLGEAHSINNNGLIAGTCGSLLEPRVFVYDSNGDVLVETIEPLPGHAATRGGYINDDGDVVGISSNANNQDSRLFIRRNGSTVDLGAASDVAGINASGAIVGTRGGQAFRYVPSGPNPGFELFGPSANGNGINDAGIVVGWLQPGSASKSAAFVRYPSGHPDAGFQDVATAIIDLSGWDQLGWASAINNHGYITGWGLPASTSSPALWVLEPQQIEPQPTVTDSHLLEFLKLFGGVSVGGGGWGLPHGGPPVPIPPHGLRALLPAQRDLAVGQLANHLAALVGNKTLGAQMHKVSRELMAAAVRELEKR